MPKTKRDAKHAEPEMSLVTVGLIASALGNILQIADRQDLAKEKEYLLRVIDEWQAAHAWLAGRTHLLEADLARSRVAIGILEDRVRDLERRLERALADAREAQAEVLRLHGEGAGG